MKDAVATLKRLAGMRGDDTLPCEDVIDIAQAVLALTVSETEPPNHCWHYLEKGGMFHPNLDKFVCCWCGAKTYVQNNMEDATCGPFDPCKFTHWAERPKEICPKREQP